MIYPIWPFFVTTVLGASLSTLGFIDGLGEAVVSLSQAVSGYLADRWQKKKVFIWTGYLCGGLSRIGYAFSTAWPQLIPFKILDRVGKIRGAPRDAMVADLSIHENRGRHFGFLRAMDNLGAVFGILLSILLVGILGYQKLFLLAAIPSFAGALLIWGFIRDPQVDGGKIFKGLSWKGLTPNFKLFLLLSAIFSLGSFSYSFLLIYAKTFGFPVLTIPLLYLLFTAMASASSLPFGRLADRIGRRPTLFLSYLLWILTALTLISLQNTGGLLLAFLLYGLHKGGLDTVQKAFVAELVPHDLRASGLGTFQMVIGLCALPASLFAGLLWDKIGLFFPLYFSVGLTAVAMVLLNFVSESGKAGK